MSLLAAIGVGSLGLAAASESNRPGSLVDYHIAGIVVLPEFGLESIYDAKKDEREGRFLTFPFGDTVQGPAGLSLVGADDLVWKAAQAAPERNEEGVQDPIQLAWMKRWHSSERRAYIQRVVIAGGVCLHTDAEGEADRPKPSSQAEKGRWISGENPSPTDPYERVVNRGHSLPEPRLSRTEAARSAMGQLIYNFVLFEDESARERAVRAKNYDTASDEIIAQIKMSPVLLVVRGGRILRPVDWDYARWGP